MRNLFTDTRVLDARCREAYGLTEEIMMENAAIALEQTVRNEHARFPGAVFVLCGSGNNGADGYALCRRLMGTIPVSAVSVAEPKSPLCIVQAERAKKVRVPKCAFDDALPQLQENGCIVVDCIFGSGFHGAITDDVREKLTAINSIQTRVVRIACDVPTGLREDGTVADGVFCADITVTMGAEKLSLYSDEAKDIAGTIICADLGVSRSLFERTEKPNAKRLEATDIRLPVRTKKNVHKGSFGHVAVALGEKSGAAHIAGTAALRFGAGWVSLVQQRKCASDTPDAHGTAQNGSALMSPELMLSDSVPEKTTALALGMGLGRTADSAAPYISWLCAHSDVPCVIDADALYTPELPALLQKRARGIVLTPHAKEFCALLANCGITFNGADGSDCAPLSAEEALRRRPALIEAFCRAYPECVLLVKGANVMIGSFSGGTMQLLVNPLGSAALAKAGSGDVLSGLIAGLLAQGYAPIDAATNGSLAHALASQSVASSYSLSPLTLIDVVASLPGTLANDGAFPAR